MVTKANLAHMGVPVWVARVMGQNAVLTSVGGTSVASAIPVAGDQYLTYIQSSNGGSGLRMPQLGGDWGPATGALEGDEFKVFNGFTSAILIYASNNALGSVVTFLMNGTSAAGTTGMSLLSGHLATMYPVSPSTWVGIKSSV